MPLITVPFVASANPAANAVASASHAGVAAVTGQPAQAHICNSIHATLTSNASLAAAIAGSIVLRDGATGVGTVLWASALSLPNVAGTASAPVEISGLAIAGTPGNAMTVEFTAAGGAGTFETVAMTGILV